MTDDIDALLRRYGELKEEEESAIEEFGALSEDMVQEVTDAYRQVNSLLEDYRDRATGTGDFGGYMEFRTKFTSFVDGLDEELPHRGAFEAASDHIDRRRLSGKNFDQAREELEPVEALVDTLETVQSLRDDRADVRADIVAERRSLIDRRDHLRDLNNVEGDALDAPIDQLEQPIERYNEGIEADHREFLNTTPARSVLAMYDRLSYFALLDIESPPAALQTLLEEHPAGNEPVGTIREYLSFSRSKLGHYVEDPGYFVGEVGPHSAYLESLSPQPFTIDWPPPEHDIMEWTLRELVQAIDRFASEETVTHLRDLRSLCRDQDRYHTLRSAARLDQELSDADRRMVVSGAVKEELTAVEETLDAVDAVLEDET